MAVQAGEAYIPVRADMSTFGKDVEQGVDKGAAGAKGKISGFAKSAGGVLAAGMAASFAKDFLGASISGARESQAIANQTAQAIKTTGAAAGVTADQVGELSASLSKKTAIDDELIQSGANLLLTFTNIKNAAGEGNDVFDQTVAIANDMSVAFGQDMKSSSIQLGKALNDPIKGVSALGRVGVSFTAQQKEQIKTLVESGDVLGAQKIILGELETQVGGSAAAQADGAKRMSLAWGNFQETIGALVIPIVDKLLGVLTPLAQWASEHPGIIMGVAAVIGGALVVAFIAWAVSAGAAAVATIAATWPIIAIVAGVAALAAGLIWAYTKFDLFRSIVNVVIEVVKTAITWYWNLYAAIFDALGKAASWVKAKVDDMVGFFTRMPGRVSGALSGMWSGLVNGFKAALNGIIRLWNNFKIEFKGYDIPGPGPNIPGFKIDTPNIPEFHTGGVYQAPPGQREGLAMLLDGERVLPPGQSGVAPQLHFHQSGHDPGAVVSAFAWAMA